MSSLHCDTPMVIVSSEEHDMKTAHRSRCSSIRGAAFLPVLPMATLERGDMFILIRVFFKAEQSMIGSEMRCKDRENLRDLCPFVEKCLRQALFFWKVRGLRRE